MNTESPERKLVERLRDLGGSVRLNGAAPVLGGWLNGDGKLVNEAADTIERLLKERDEDGWYTEAHERLDDLARESIARSDRLLALLGEVSGGLEPFSKACECIQTSREDTRIIGRVLVKHFRQASALYERVKGELAGTSCASPTSSGSALRTRESEPSAEREP